MKIMAGIDLHSNNLVCAFVDKKGKRILHKRQPCSLPVLLKTLQPYKASIDTIAVESTFNWYWLVDGLLEKGYNVVLANPAAMEQYEGLKHTNDDSDAYFLAELLRLGILPTGHIYDRKVRPIRDMLRRRLGLVQKRTGIMLSLRSLYSRTLGSNLTQSELKTATADDAGKWFKDPADQLVASELALLVEVLSLSIRKLENKLLAESRGMETFQKLQTIPGIGNILGMTISLETGPADRFASAGNFASYCRCVKSERLSNGKAKGRNNQKCGNKYLGWAFVEAAHMARRFCPEAARFYDRKRAKTNTMVATKALACKLAKAAWHVMKHNEDFDVNRVFGSRTPEEDRPEEKRMKKAK